MAKIIKRIKVQSLEFGNPPFRKLGNLKIEFADRLTLIAGHNGVGKSTILGLVANTFGLTTKGGPRSYFGDPFYANIERIVYLALEEVSKSQEHPEAAPTVIANVDGFIVRKRCAMTQRSEWKRARVVPRTIDKSDTDPIGPDAKVPLPTIYLGIRRLATTGEADESEVISKKISMDDDDRKLMTDFVKSVIIGCQLTTDVTHQSIKGSKKKSTHPGYESHDALAISMGQDSLGSIATALASFNQLKRDSGDDYVGGLLIIDELDVGFHPHAIDRLVKALKLYANHLYLQIIATTHSPRLIEAIHPEGGGNAKSPDAVVYLLDTKHPRLAEDQSIAAILDDMAQRHVDYGSPKPKKPVLCAYFEDPEGAQFGDALISSAKRAALGRKYGVRIKLIPLGVGGSNLINLPDNDPIFKDRLLIVDADTSIPKKAALRGNALKLPCAKGASGTERSPENTIKKFLRSLVAAEPGTQLHQAMLRLSVTNPSSDKVLTTFFSNDVGDSNHREQSKGWWVRHWLAIEKWGVIREWAICNKSEVDSFKNAFEAAISSTSKRLK